MDGHAIRARWGDASRAALVMGAIVFCGASAFATEWTGAARNYWAYTQPVPAPLPAIQNENWPRADLDYFILAKLQAADLAPSPDAAPNTLLRRLYFDLVGLPPSPAQLKTFNRQIKSHSLDAALAITVDNLLASPRFGERWARMWLDVARYAESSGKDSNFTFPYAWRYRDYVIDAFNADKPYNRFITEQIAGDLLPYKNESQHAKLLIATSYLAFGPKGLNENDKKRFDAEVIDEQIDAVTKGFIASTVACARCHDHPSDPFAMEDYYALAGVFSSTESHFGTPVGPSNNQGGTLTTLPFAAHPPGLHKSVKPTQVQKFHNDLADLDVESKTLIAERKMTLQDAIRIKWRKGALKGNLAKYDSTGVALPLTMGVSEADQIKNVPLLERGELDRPRDLVPRGFPSIIELEHTPKAPKNQSGRLQLAQWLTAPDHPLTARVMANRIWRTLLGVGIVRTVDQFGTSGEAPSHPALLNHLALALIDQNWSVKSLIKRIVLSRTYRQSSTYNADHFNIDPDNRLLWRTSKRRLTAEAIRDAMLAISSDITLTRPIGSLVGRIGDRPISIIGFDKRMPGDIDGSTHRSIFLPVMRDKLPDILELFDFAEPSMVTGDRNTTNVPLQSLYLLNSAFVTARAQSLARRVMQESKTANARIRQTFTLCYARLPDKQERALAKTFLKRGATLGEDEAAVLAAYCQALLCAGEFRYLD